MVGSTQNDRAAKAVEGVVENSTSTGVRIEGIWYTLPRDLDARPPDRGARVELKVTSRHFVTALKIVAPAPEPTEADRPIVRASVLRSAAEFAGTHTEPLRSRETLELAEAFETWVYRTIDGDGTGEATEMPSDRERRRQRQTALSSVVAFLANKPEARPEHILVVAEDWERWLDRPGQKAVFCRDCGQPLAEAAFADGTSWPVAQLAQYGRERHERVLCQQCFVEASGDAEPVNRPA